MDIVIVTLNSFIEKIEFFISTELCDTIRIQII